jgi:hypothetical protein
MQFVHYHTWVYLTDSRISTSTQLNAEYPPHSTPNHKRVDHRDPNVEASISPPGTPNDATYSKPTIATPKCNALDTQRKDATRAGFYLPSGRSDRPSPALSLIFDVSSARVDIALLESSGEPEPCATVAGVGVGTASSCCPPRLARILKASWKRALILLLLRALATSSVLAFALPVSSPT